MGEIVVLDGSSESVRGSEISPRRTSQVTRHGLSRRVLIAPPLTGKRAWFFAAVAVGVPTLIRVAVHGSVSSAVFLTYIPFVLLAVMALRPWAAATIALACAVLADFFFIKPYFAFADGPNDLFGIGAFLVTSALLIGLVHVVRRFLGDCLHPDLPHEISRKIIFSEREGEAWASWQSGRPPVKLGPHTDVARMMEDYIAQVELGERLLGRDYKS